jgi:hypothetical protein
VLQSCSAPSTFGIDYAKAKLTLRRQQRMFAHPSCAPFCFRFRVQCGRGKAGGFGLGFTSIDPIRMLIWSAVLNGVVAVPIMAVMMLIVANLNVMGRFTAKSWLVWSGWIGTGLMALAVLAMLGKSLLGD